MASFTAALYEKMVQGDRVALGQAMTLVESDRMEDRQNAIQLLEWCEEGLRKNDPSLRFAVSGSPGVGKSSWIETIGLKAVSEGFKVGVLTIDPTSSVSHGSILGDKSRMTRLSVSPFAFIRSTAAGSVLGGLGRRSFEMMTLLAAVGYNLIFVETVGVGQSEHISREVTDGFILVLQPGGGDELQGIKRGITELADIILVNKADGDLAGLARISQSHYQNALHFFSSLRTGWSPKVLTCSAMTGDGIDEAWEVIRSYQESFIHNMSIFTTRNHQKLFWLTWSLRQTAHVLLMNHPLVLEKLKAANLVSEGEPVSFFKTEFEIENLMKSLIHTA